MTTDWLSQHRNDSGLVILDCRIRMEPDGAGAFRYETAREDYNAGHIPAAGFADLMVELRDTESPLVFALPSAADFCAAMGALGVGDDSRVVLYDDFLSIWAARVWWMLRWVGFDRAAILDGGLTAWNAEGRPLSAEPAGKAARTLTPHVRPEVIADHPEVRAAVADGSACLIDTMHGDHYQGAESFFGRPGRIQGASNLFSGDLVDESGRYKPDNELSKLVTGDRNARNITYCGGGIMASSNAFIMSRLGFTDVAVYIGSLQEWTADPANPMEVGES
ncbi:MAG: sulfurtransferase [Pseudomonadota bacterium]